MPTERERRAFYGDLLLPDTLYGWHPSEPRGSVQWHDGLDQQEAVAFAQSPNYRPALEVVTFWDPEASYTKEGFRAKEAAVRAAARARSERSDPVFWVEDIGLTVSTYVGTTVTTSAAHGLIVGDVVLVRRNGLGLFTYAELATVGSTTTFDVADGHGIANGDDVYRVEEYIAGQIFRDLAQISVKPEKGDHYEPAAKFLFFGSHASWYTREAVTLA